MLEERGAKDARPLTVTALNRLVKETIEDRFPAVLVTGELSRVTRAASGHVYFNLKDESSTVAAVLWASSARSLSVPLSEGLAVEVRGQATLYPQRGAYQLVCSSIRLAGEGSIRAAFLRLKATLEAEGLLDPSRKRPLPRLPKCVGVITSGTGAAFEDIKRSIWDRFPSMPILLCAARVQGPEAVSELRGALERMNAAARCDVLIIGRGGGSVEDLQAFNDEALARAIAVSRIPVVSAVGHEIDISISDLVADVRALTPTAAGALVVPEWDTLHRELATQASRARRAAERRWIDVRARAEDLLRRARKESLPRRLQEYRQTIDYHRLAAQRSLRARVDLARLTLQGLSHRLLKQSGAEQVRGHAGRLGLLSGRLRQVGCPPLAQAQKHLMGLSASLVALNPLSVLARGFAVVQRVGDQSLVRSADGLVAGEALRISFARGRDVDVEVRDLRERVHPSLEETSDGSDSQPSLPRA
jgi:exodeoxyribonuclease VII large subunit